MSRFDKAVEYLLAREGDLVEDPLDRGGITRFGISLRFLRSIEHDTVLADHIKSLTIGQAKDIYKREFWDRAPFEKITSQNIVNYLFEAAVNMGISPAIKCAQRAVVSVMGNRNAIVEDGILGNDTLEMINHCKFYLLPALRSERAAYYREMVVSNPGQKRFLQEWLNRALNEVV